MTLREALDLLTEGDYLKRISRHNAAEFVEAVAVVTAAARRFLALTETGPDYEAAAQKIYELKHDVISHDYNESARLIVDAALADYLTEEDR